MASILAPTILVVGLVLSGLLAWAFEADAARRDALDFERVARSVRRDVNERVLLYDYGLRGARGVFVASDRVTRKEFLSYTASRKATVEFPGALGVGFVRRVAVADVPAFVASARADGAPDFAVHPAPAATASGDVFVVEFVEPVDANREALGFDVGSEHARRAAAEHAARTGEPALTAPIRLVQAPAEGPAYVYFMPVYRVGAALDSEAARVRALNGWTYMPIVMARVMAGLARELAEVDLEIHDTTEGEPGELVFDARPGHDARARALVDVTTLTVGGRTWSLTIGTLPSFVTTSRLPIVIIGASGAVLALLLAGLVRQLASARERAEARAAEMTIELQAKSRELERLALFDALTGLPNRRLLSDRLAQAMLAATRDPGRHYAVLFIDLDDFKRINDELGHAAGDELLRRLASRLKAHVRAVDSVARDIDGATTARLGGDEFVVLLQGLKEPTDARLVAERLVACIREPLLLAGQTVVPRASIGLVVGTPGLVEPELLLAAADRAMYRAKAAGKGQLVELALDGS